jgi:hypothetical protein
MVTARQPDTVTSRAIARWHALLCAVAALNVALWALSAVAVTRAESVIDAEANATSHLQLLLAAVYVFVCAFRSVLPVYDIPRIVLVDSRLSSVAVGRSVATIAELCFAAQWALILHRIALLSHSPFGQTASLAIVPLIVLAEGFSWYAVLTTEQRGHVVENSLWGLSATLLVAGLLVIGPHRVAELYPPMIVWCIGGAAYVAFIFLFDVPMYWSRWRADQTPGRQYLSLAQGMVDVYQRRVVSDRWEDWKTEVLWMSLYFTLGVWSSVSVVYAALALGAHRS